MPDPAYTSSVEPEDPDRQAGLFEPAPEEAFGWQFGETFEESIQFTRREALQFITAEVDVEIFVLARHEGRWLKGQTLEPGSNRREVHQTAAQLEAGLARCPGVHHFKAGPNKLMLPVERVLPAVRVGSAGLAVLDIDRHAGGADGFMALASEGIQVNDHTSHAVPTLNGGLHLIYRRSAGTPAKKLQFERHGLDLLTSSQAASATAVVCYGSASLYLEAPEIPADLLDAIKGLTARAAKASGRPAKTSSGASGQTLAEIVAKIGTAKERGESRTNTLYSAAIKAFGEADRSRRWTADQATLALQQAAQAAGLTDIDRHIERARATAATAIEDRIADDLFEGGERIRYGRESKRLLLCSEDGIWDRDANEPIEAKIFRWLKDEANGVPPQLRTERYAERIAKRFKINWEHRQIHESEVLDADPAIVGCPDGQVYELETGKLRAARPADLVSRRLAAAPAVGATEAALDACEWWRLLVLACGGALDVASYVEELLSCCFDRYARHRTMILLHGPRRTSKGTVLETIAAALGDYAADMPEELQRRNSHVPEEQIAKLERTRLLTYDELASLTPDVVRWLKRMTGGATVDARHLWGRVYRFRPQFTVLMTSNVVPELLRDSGLMDRLIVVPFSVGHSLAESDGSLKERLRVPEEQSLMLERIGRAHRRKLARGAGGRLAEAPEIVRRHTADFWNQADKLSVWYEERIDPDAVGQTDRRALWEDYKEVHCKGKPKLGRNAFYASLEAKYGPPKPLDGWPSFPILLREAAREAIKEAALMPYGRQQ